MLKFNHLDTEFSSSNISTEDMKKVLGEFKYVFGRSTVFVDKLQPYTEFFVTPSSSQWGSKTDITLSVRQAQQKHVDEQTCRLRLIIVGTSTHDRMENIGMGEWALPFFNADNEETDLFVVRLECEYFPIADLPYSLADLNTMVDLYRHDIPLFPGMTLKLPGYEIETGGHSCENCDGERCFYSDFDGQISYLDGRTRKFHVTCDGNLQLT